ncbi:Gx transporter family protein [Lachnospiraceae bacterium ZAX-1]
MKHDKLKAHKTALLGMLLALALLCGYVESLIPFYFGIPGMKLGLANLVVLMAMYLVGSKEALFISILRIMLAGFLFGSMFSIVYSLAGGLLSFFIMLILKKTDRFHIISVSVAGGVFHNIGQLIVAAFVLENFNIFYYITVLFLAGVITGGLIGVVGQEIIVRLGKIGWGDK